MCVCIYIYIYRYSSLYNSNVFNLRELYNPREDKTVRSIKKHENDPPRGMNMHCPVLNVANLKELSQGRVWRKGRGRGRDIGGREASTGSDVFCANNL